MFTRKSGKFKGKRLSCKALYKKIKILADIRFSLVLEKVLKELIEPYSVRVQRLGEFLQDTKPSLQVEIVPLEDPFGVSIVDPLLKCIVVSEETRKGGEAVNKKRIENVSSF